MANLGIRTDASGTFGALTLGGVDKVTVDNTGIQAGSYAPDSITATELAPGALIETSPLNGIGYGPGAGGTVTQATSKSTAVTLNKPTGTITMHNASLAASATVAFLVQNSILGPATDSVICGVIADSVSNQLSYTLTCNPGYGGFYILLTNRSAGALAEAVRIRFEVIKGATS